MNKKIAALFLAIGLVVLPGLASADHGGEEVEASHATTAHDDHGAVSITVSSGDDRITQMETLVALLTELIDLLKHQLEHQATEVIVGDHDDVDADDDHSDDMDHDDDADDDHDGDDA